MYRSGQKMKFLKIRALKKLEMVFQDRFMSEDSMIESFKTDESGLAGKLPYAVIFPINTDEVAFIARMCYRHRICYAVRGLGTGKTGGALLKKGGVIISLEKMQKIEIDTTNMLACVEPGVITGQLQKDAAVHGLFYPVDPASLEMSSLGGNIAENAGGPRAFKYGVTRDYVLGLEVVLPDGKVIRLGGKTRKNVTGYNLRDIFIGSEGTLGIITQAYLKLIPLPKVRFLLWAVFDDFQKALKAITRVYTSGLSPSAIEFVEGRAFQAVEKLTGEAIPHAGEAAHLLVELDGHTDGAVQGEAKEISELLEKGGAAHVLAVPYERQQEDIWDLRRKISEATKYISFNKKSEDVVVPPCFLTEFLLEIKEIEQKYGISIICYGHLGDGNVHVNILNVEDETGFVWEKFQEQLTRSLFERTKKFQGALSGEHGIGMTKRPFLKMFLDKQTLALHKKIKKLFDPKKLLNPGKIW